MRTAKGAVLLLALIAFPQPGPASFPDADPATSPDASPPRSGITAAELTGTWAGSLSHEGETTPIALHFEPGEGDKILIKMSVPVIHVSESPLGSAALQIEGDEIRLGPFSFTHDRAAGTLTGTVPERLVPVYHMTVILRHVERFEAPARPGIAASVRQPEWTFEAGAPLWPGATFAAGVVYAGGEDGVLHAIAAGTGAERWWFRAGGAIRTRATVAGDAVYFQADDGLLYRLAASDGAERWRVRVCDRPIVRLPFSDPKSRFDRFGSDVTVAGGRLYLGTHEGRVLALDPADGSAFWSFPAGDAVLAAPAVGKGRVYFGSFDHHVYALEAATGRLVWKYGTQGPVVSTPALDRGRVVIGSRSYDFLGLDAKSGEPAWKRYFWFSWVESSARIHDGVAYVGSSDAAALFAFDGRTGRRLWHADVHGWAWGQPAVTVKRVYIGTVGTGGYLAPHRGGALAVDRATGKPVWRFEALASNGAPYGFAGSPAVGAGLVFFTGLDGSLHAFPES